MTNPQPQAFRHLPVKDLVLTFVELHQRLDRCSRGFRQDDNEIARLMRDVARHERELSELDTVLDTLMKAADRKRSHYAASTRLSTSSQRQPSWDKSTPSGFKELEARHEREIQELKAKHDHELEERDKRYAHRVALLFNHLEHQVSSTKRAFLEPPARSETNLISPAQSHGTVAHIALPPAQPYTR